MGHTYSHTDDGVTYQWEVKKLWEMTKDQTFVEWSIPESFLQKWFWGQTHLCDHIGRVLEADLSFPILVHNGNIVDGCHRAIKVLAHGRKKIHAIVLSEMPFEPEIVEPKPEESNDGIAWTNSDLVRIMEAYFKSSKPSHNSLRHPLDGV
jgi:hypothetical protein